MSTILPTSVNECNHAEQPIIQSAQDYGTNLSQNISRDMSENQKDSLAFMRNLSGKQDVPNGFPSASDIFQHGGTTTQGQRGQESERNGEHHENERGEHHHHNREQFNGSN